MLFSSTVFLFLFLPITIGIYYGLLKKRISRNLFLLLMSLICYGWGEPKYVFLMLFCILLNYVGGYYVDYYRSKPKTAKMILILTVIGNLGILSIFKYLGFMLETTNQLFNANISIPNIILPIGISFFTFQGMSYVLDVYMERGKVQKNPLNVALYVALFPQLVAGPIVRYETVATEIEHRKETADDFAEGVVRFIKGMGKKVLLANQFGLIADKAFSMPAGEIAIGFAWLGAIGYMLQIFYDFSGYSDMAIGLGKMFGFHFNENFNAPYLAKSVSEFWRRWHISLGSWFRDYVYFPLGGSRVNSNLKLFRNLFVVWLLTGIWHGANWTFICWGLYFFVWIALEKFLNLEKRLQRSRVFSHIYLLLIVILGWVLFRADSIGYALEYIKSMFGLNSNVLLGNLGLLYWQENRLLLGIGILLCLPLSKLFSRFKITSDSSLYRVKQVATLIVGILLFITVLAYLIKSSYNPFIYFNF